MPQSAVEIASKMRREKDEGNWLSKEQESRWISHFKELHRQQRAWGPSVPVIFEHAFSKTGLQGYRALLIYYMAPIGRYACKW